MSISTEIQRLLTAKSDLKTAIEDKGVEVGEGTIDTYAGKVREIAGASDVIDFMRYVKSFTLATTEGLPEDLVLNLDNVTTFDNTFSNLKVENINHLTINCLNQVTSLFRMIYGGYPTHTYSMERLTLNMDTSKCTNFRQSLTNMPKLKVIDGMPLDFSSNTNTIGLFDYCFVLEEVRVVEESIKISMAVNKGIFSKETITSFVNGLNGDVTDQTLTLSKTAVNTAFETAEGLADGNTSEEWLNLIATKPNWTITLS